MPIGIGPSTASLNTSVASLASRAAWALASVSEECAIWIDVERSVFCPRRLSRNHLLLEMAWVRAVRLTSELRSLTQDIDEATGTEQIDPTGELVRLLGVLEADARHFAACRLAMRDFGKGLSSVDRATFRVANGFVAMADAARDLRGSVMANDANVCASQHARRVQPAESSA